MKQATLFIESAALKQLQTQLNHLIELGCRIVAVECDGNDALVVIEWLIDKLSRDDVEQLQAQLGELGWVK